jgi:hypothetical protein
MPDFQLSKKWPFLGAALLVLAGVGFSLLNNLAGTAAPEKAALTLAQPTQNKATPTAATLPISKPELM